MIHTHIGEAAGILGAMPPAGEQSLGLSHSEARTEFPGVGRCRHVGVERGEGFRVISTVLAGSIRVRYSGGSWRVLRQGNF